MSIQDLQVFRDIKYSTYSSILRLISRKASMKTRFTTGVCVPKEVLISGLFCRHEWNSTAFLVTLTIKLDSMKAP